MHVFEFHNTRPDRRVLVIGETYRAYEQEDGSVLLNDEKQGYSFYPKETYEEFRTKFLLPDWLEVAQQREPEDG
ncbi:hypothetical protein [Salmonella phage vB_SpuM_X5]|uniref:Uncharacterized protein n=2 Tax=Tequintavirus S131 TaxID=2733989 RepID=A0A2Z5HNM5_9CAUD|nr:hypothetical protein HOT63_gp133 [Salmonella phage S131]AXC41564.1 hypothetical protein [Salmonella phage S130]AXC41714.1 hypothetical protein [Salmonella phage S131]